MKAAKVFLTLSFILLSGMASSADMPQRLNKVVLVLFENTTYDTTMKAPTFRALAKQGGFLTNYEGITNPSQPNYVAIMGGDTLGVLADGRNDLYASNLADLIEAKGLQWKVYAEGYPGNCFLGMSKGAYVRKHNPLISFVGIQRNKQRCERIVNASGFARDLAEGRLPEFTHYVPDMNNTGHDTGIAGADRFLAKTLLPLMQSEQGQRVTWILTFDEGHIFNNHIFAIVYGDQVKAGSQTAQAYDHYSLLRTIEEGFSLGTLGRKDARAVPFTGIWKH